jgi:hypothetical protein
MTALRVVTDAHTLSVGSKKLVQMSDAFWTSPSLPVEEEVDRNEREKENRARRRARSFSDGRGGNRETGGGHG